MFPLCAVCLTPPDAPPPARLSVPLLRASWGPGGYPTVFATPSVRYTVGVGDAPACVGGQCGTSANVAPQFQYERPGLFGRIFGRR